MHNAVKENIQTFNSLAGSYRNTWVADRKKAERIRAITGELGIKKGMKIVEPGCGRGDYTPFILEKAGKNGTVDSVDVADRMVDIAAENLRSFKNAAVHRLDAKNMPFDSGSMDMVVCFNCFPHFYPKQDYVNEFARVLKGGGFFVIAHSMTREKINSMHRGFGFDPEKHFLPSKREIAAIGAKAGLYVEKYFNKGYYILKAVKR